MYKQITAGNLYDLGKKMENAHDCKIFIKPRVLQAIKVMPPEGYEVLRKELKEKNIELVEDI